MTTIYMATGNALVVLHQENNRWSVLLQLFGRPTQCVAVDPLQPRTVYCGTFGEGLWCSRDAGGSWWLVSNGIPYQEIMAVAVSRLERNGEVGVVWAGTEPSALFRSEDQGASWQERPTLRELPSAPTWSFPPRPWTSHVRWIEPDPNVAERLFVGIELGGVMRSLDSGITWEDRKPGSQYDAHTLRTHRLAPGRVYEAAGGGYAQSDDGGETWYGYDEGLGHHYIWGLAVDPGNPDVVVISAAPGPRQAHDRNSADVALYRRTGDGPWKQVHDGLPMGIGTGAYVLAANEAEPGVIYAATRKGDLYRSPNAGISWERLDVKWLYGYEVPDVRGLAVVELG
jgi:photosystem II stability/assembly factor-like uncharacterized protein